MHSPRIVFSLACYVGDRSCPGSLWNLGLLVSCGSCGSVSALVLIAPSIALFTVPYFLATASYTTSISGGFTFNCEAFYFGKSRPRNLITQTYAFQSLRIDRKYLQAVPVGSSLLLAQLARSYVTYKIYSPLVSELTAQFD